ncbi:oligosaccharide flippase family protein [Chloroflexota bacterium]
MGISIIDITRNSLKLSSVGLLGSLISLPVGIYVATILVPEEYGVYGFLGLWLTYATLIRPGLTASGYREIPVLLGKGEEKEALRIQNISISSDMLYSILPVVVILGASLIFSEPILKFGLILTAIGYGTRQFVNYWDGINFVRQNFNIVARGKLIAAVASSLVIIASVYWLKVYALLIAPICVSIVLGIYYWQRGPIHFHFTLDWKETVRLAKIGVVLQAGSLVLWAFRLADRTIIAATLPLEQLGFYTFAIGFLMTLLTLPTNFTNVLQPVLYKELGRISRVFEGLKDTGRIAVYLALGTALLIPVSQLGFYFIVNLITTSYINSIPIFYILSYNLFLTSIRVVPAIILKSSIINKQKISLSVQTVGLVLNIVLDLIVVKLGYGVIGVAWVTICTQSLVTFTIYYLAKNYMFQNKLDYFRLQIAMVVPFLVTILFYFFHNYLSMVTPNIWTFAGISLITQAILWSFVIGIFYRDYLSINDIRAIIRELKTTIKGG